mmetsp:Transcript_81425/g.225500  ORF Transcript_81425/g.225500 Transcript_81425/m.225500 type:complete len:92 (-) Transcript_81425:21-296(-)
MLGHSHQPREAKGLHIDSVIYYSVCMDSCTEGACVFLFMLVPQTVSSEHVVTVNSLARASLLPAFTGSSRLAGFRHARAAFARSCGLLISW